MRRPYRGITPQTNRPDNQAVVVISTPAFRLITMLLALSNHGWRSTPTYRYRVS